MARSRIRRNIDGKTRQHIVVVLVGFALLTIFLFVFGIPLLINLSLIFQNRDAQEQKSLTQDQEVILPPTIDIPFTATNSAGITINGTAENGEIINLYINNALVDEEKIREDKSFTFENVRLKKGENAIYTRAEKKNSKESDSSEVQTIFFLPDPPSLSVDFPSDGLTVGGDFNPLRVRGTTDENVAITVNGFRAVVDSSGKFTYNLSLTNGENRIKFTATDRAGNKAEREIKVTLQ